MPEIRQVAIVKAPQRMVVRLWKVIEAMMCSAPYCGPVVMAGQVVLDDEWLKIPIIARRDLLRSGEQLF